MSSSVELAPCLCTDLTVDDSELGRSLERCCGVPVAAEAERDHLPPWAACSVRWDCCADGRDPIDREVVHWDYKGSPAHHNAAHHHMIDLIARTGSDIAVVDRSLAGSGNACHLHTPRTCSYVVVDGGGRLVELRTGARQGRNANVEGPSCCMVWTELPSRDAASWVARTSDDPSAAGVEHIELQLDVASHTGRSKLGLEYPQIPWAVAVEHRTGFASKGKRFGPMLVEEGFGNCEAQPEGSVAIYVLSMGQAMAKRLWDQTATASSSLVYARAVH